MKERYAELDVLRILSMLMIIMLHTIIHTGVLESIKEGTILYVYEYYLYALSQVCVNSFVMISGYFLVKSKFKLKKLVNMWIEVVFYSFFLKLLCMITGEISFSVVSLISCFVPVFTGRYWFITIYFGMYILSPFLNIAINGMNKKQHTELCVILFLLFCVWSSIHPSVTGMNVNGGWSIAWFIVLYLVSSWIRNYYRPSGKYLKYIFVVLICPAIMTLLICMTNRIGIGTLKTIAIHQYGYSTILVFVETVALFLMFINLNIKNSKVVTKISSLTLGVYLIHDHANFRVWLWNSLNLAEKLKFPQLCFYQIIVVLFIFTVCIIIDYLRSVIFKNSIEKWIDRICDKVRIAISN